MSPTIAEIESLKARYTAAGQDHLFTFYEDLTPEEQTTFLNQLDKLDIERVNQIFKKAVATSRNSNNKNQNLEPLPDDVFDSVLDTNEDKIKEWEKLGFNMIAQNKVCAILMAGGQGTRLGSSAPKGCYDIHLPSGKSLFQLQAERILRLQKVAQDIRKPKMKFATETFFKQHNYFGLKEENVIFFEQGTLPALTYEGKVLMETKSTLAVAPNGNGGMYVALRKEKIFESMIARNISYVHVYCVDNCLVRVADPIFIGYCISKNVDCGTKVVRRIDPHESAGVIALRDGKFIAIGCSEIEPAVAEQRKPNGQLTYGAASIANHFYTVDFLKHVESFENELEYHIANKKIKHIDINTGELIFPSKPNGMKLELFVSGVFPFTKRMAVLEADRKDEFSPLKNGPNTACDNPETCRRDIINLYVRFVEKAGGTVIPGEGDSFDNLSFEISPLVSYSGEGLEKLKGKTIKAPFIFETPADLDKFY
ncbi:9318_t:CDS:2 [Dentiscutata heterogama]|uniref:9318_t:CDS:1 n=1 Tax=Dentiscutata heterogama TaxID=1316150 RepID=A0ACA9N704_9GLOM|nr:9318_t:CDS:2 [Dentiscutata heterogama]